MFKLEVINQLLKGLGVLVHLVAECQRFFGCSGIGTSVVGDTADVHGKILNGTGLCGGSSGNLLNLISDTFNLLDHYIEFICGLVCDLDTLLNIGNGLVDKSGGALCRLNGLSGKLGYFRSYYSETSAGFSRTCGLNTCIE